MCFNTYKIYINASSCSGVCNMLFLFRRCLWDLLTLIGGLSCQGRHTSLTRRHYSSYDFLVVHWAFNVLIISPGCWHCTVWHCNPESSSTEQMITGQGPETNEKMRIGRTGPLGISLKWSIDNQRFSVLESTEYSSPQRLYKMDWLLYRKSEYIYLNCILFYFLYQLYCIHDSQLPSLCTCWWIFGIIFYPYYHNGWCHMKTRVYFILGMVLE